MQIKILINSFSAGKKMLVDEIHEVEHNTAEALIRCGQAIEHVVKEVEEKFSKKPEASSPEPVTNPNQAKIDALKAEIAAIEALPPLPTSETNEVGAITNEARAAEIADLQKQIVALGG